MSVYCDVALPVPLDRVFTYAMGVLDAVVGARVLVPFGGQRLVGVVVRLHDVAPGEEVQVKRVERVLDEEALLPGDLMELARWIATYYCAPLGEVLRGMVPVTAAEVRRQWVYRIAERGRRVLFEAAMKGSSRRAGAYRSRQTVEVQNLEYAVLNYLESGDAVKAATVRSATGGKKALLDAMARKRWLVREPLAEVRDARRVESVAVLVESGGSSAHPNDDDAVVRMGHPGVGGGSSAHPNDDDAVVRMGHPGVGGTGESSSGESVGQRRLPRLNENQLAVMAELAGCGGRELVRVLRARLVQRGVPESSLGTLVKRGLVRLEEVAQGFTVSGLGSGGKKFAHEHALNEAQMAALAEIVAAMQQGARSKEQGAGREEGVGVEKQVPFGDDNQKCKGNDNDKGETRVSFGDDRQRGKSLNAEGAEVGGLEGVAESASSSELRAASLPAFGLRAASLPASGLPVAGGFQALLLYGVTGSGKTAVYVAAIERALAAGKSALLLVPEIGLTPGTAAQMVAAFGSEVALLHSQLTPDERAEQWHRIRRGEARVVVGTRSAVFAPLPELGLILVDEEHDGSYKQEETPRYHGRDVAVMRAKLLGCTVVLGSATPSLESWNNAERGRYRRVEMLQRVQDRALPAVEMIDMREEFRQTGKEQLFSRALLEETQKTLDRGEQVVILINRRGYSFVVMCRSCGEKLECENCAISLTYHKGADTGDVARVGQRLECHYCGYTRRVPETCPKCASEHLYYMGAGSQQGEERLAELFPEARIGRMDRDTVRGRGDMERLLSQLHAGEIDLLVGTQMIAKGHDIHGVTLVGVVGADFALGLPDFRAAERVFQLLTQVSGRAGRGELPGRVLVQTYQPEHYVNQFARTHDYTGFAAREMYFRRAMRYPPLSVLANVIVSSEKLEEVLDYAARIGRWFKRRAPEGVRVLGPAAAPNARLKRIYRYHLVLKSDRRDVLGAVLKEMMRAMEAEGVPLRAVAVDVDPMHLM